MSRHKDKGPKSQNVSVASPQTDTLSDIPFTTPPTSGSWTTDYAWVCGVVGALAVVLCAIAYNLTDALANGVHIASIKLTHTRQDSILLALLISSASMLITEMIRLWLRDRNSFFNLNPDLKAGRYGVFLFDVIANWLLYLSLLGVVVLFFYTAGEYGYARSAPYYKAWFRFIDLAFAAYLYGGGLLYVTITRALKHDPVSDRRDFSSLVAKILWFAFSLVPGFKSLRPQFDDIDKKALRALLVKLFFAPLMTVFFTSQFPHLVQNVGYLADGLPAAITSGTYTLSRFNIDLY